MPCRAACCSAEIPCGASPSTFVWSSSSLFVASVDFLPVWLICDSTPVTFLMKPVYTSRTVFLPPQQQQSAAASALASLGALSGLAGAAAGIKSPADQYVALLQSTSVADRLIDEFKLMQVYESRFRFEAQKSLAKRSSTTRLES